MFTVEKFAKDFVSYVFDIEDAIIVSMDVAIWCDAKISGEHFLNPAEIERYFNCVAYDVAENAKLL